MITSLIADILLFAVRKARSCIGIQAHYVMMLERFICEYCQMKKTYYDLVS